MRCWSAIAPLFPRRRPVLRPLGVPGAPGAPVLLALLLAGAPAVAGAQRARTFTACTPDALAFCAELRLTAGPTTFELALRTLGGAPATSPFSFYNLVLGTGAAAAAVPRTTALTSGAVGGAAVTDARPWELFDTGDALFLSALTDRGVGGCVTGADIGGFGQAATTCGAGQFVTFTFTPAGAFDPVAFDLGAFSVLDLEAVALTPGLPAASCGAEGRACVITADVPTPGTTITPEPATLALVGAGLLLTGVAANARRRGA